MAMLSGKGADISDATRPPVRRLVSGMVQIYTPLRLPEDAAGDGRAGPDAGHAGRFLAPACGQYAYADRRNR